MPEETPQSVPESVLITLKNGHSILVNDDMKEMVRVIMDMSAKTPEGAHDRIMITLGDRAPGDPDHVIRLCEIASMSRYEIKLPPEKKKSGPKTGTPKGDANATK